MTVKAEQCEWTFKLMMNVMSVITWLTCDVCQMF